MGNESDRLLPEPPLNPELCERVEHWVGKTPSWVGILLRQSGFSHPGQLALERLQNLDLGECLELALLMLDAAPNRAVMIGTFLCANAAPEGTGIRRWSS